MELNTNKQTKECACLYVHSEYAKINLSMCPIESKVRYLSAKYDLTSKKELQGTYSNPVTVTAPFGSTAAICKTSQNNFIGS